MFKALYAKLFGSEPKSKPTPFKPFKAEYQPAQYNLQDLKGMGWKLKRNLDETSPLYSGKNWKYALKKVRTATGWVIVRIAEVAYNTFIIAINGKILKEKGTRGKFHRWYNTVTAALAELKMMYGGLVYG